jgi:pimeloyl-ACP methyl ester carboxylesterase
VLRGATLVFASFFFAASLALASHGAWAATSVVHGNIRIWKIAYRAHNGERRYAYVALPRSYGPRHAPPIPLVISPHGRGVTGRHNVSLWGQLPAVGEFAVVSPDGQGRLLANYSWGSAGQISDLARMPKIVRLALPWLRVAPHRVYAFGGSMGGQEILLLLARYPHLLAGVAAFDPVVDFALQYRDFPKLACTTKCQKTWNGPIGSSLQSLARDELGGPPAKVPYAYELRSPLTYARAIAFSHVPLQVWWSPNDRIVVQQPRQSGRFLKTIMKLNPKADIVGYTGGWRHSAEMRAQTHLPFALATFGLLPERYEKARGVRAFRRHPADTGNGIRPVTSRADAVTAVTVARFG